MALEENAAGVADEHEHAGPEDEGGEEAWFVGCWERWGGDGVNRWWREGGAMRGEEREEPGGDDHDEREKPDDDGATDGDEVAYDAKEGAKGAVQAESVGAWDASGSDHDDGDEEPACGCPPTCDVWGDGDAIKVPAGMEEGQACLAVEQECAGEVDDCAAAAEERGGAMWSCDVREVDGFKRECAEQHDADDEVSLADALECFGAVYGCQRNIALVGFCVREGGLTWVRSEFTKIAHGEVGEGANGDAYEQEAK